MKRVLLLIATAMLTFGQICQWSIAGAAPIVHTVTFFSNAATGAQSESFQVSATSTTLTTFAKLNPQFSNPGNVFVGWNTMPTGKGTTYSNGATYSFRSNLVLYAQWQSIFKSVLFEENRSTIDSVSSTETQSSASPLTLFGSLTPQFSNPGFTFAGWNTKANGKGTALSDGQTYGFTSDLVLYAQWRKAPPMQPALVMVGALGPTSHATLTSIAGALTAQHAHVVEVVQCGAKAPAGSVVATSLTRLLLGHHNGSVNVTFRGFTQSAGPNLTEVFASELVPN